MIHHAWHTHGFIHILQTLLFKWLKFINTGLHGCCISYYATPYFTLDLIQYAFHNAISKVASFQRFNFSNKGGIIDFNFAYLHKGWRYRRVAKGIASLIFSVFIQKPFHNKLLLRRDSTKRIRGCCVADLPHMADKLGF